MAEILSTEADRVLDRSSDNATGADAPEIDNALLAPEHRGDDAAPEVSHSVEYRTQC